MYSGESDALDLDINILGQCLDSDAASGGLVGEPLLVLRVHLLFILISCILDHGNLRSSYSKVTHVGKEDVNLDNLGDGGTSLNKDGLEVAAALLGLLGDRSLEQLTLRSERDLTGAVDSSRGLDGLGLFHGVR